MLLAKEIGGLKFVYLVFFICSRRMTFMPGYMRDKFFINSSLEYVDVGGTSCPGNRGVNFYLNSSLVYFVVEMASYQGKRRDKFYINIFCYMLSSMELLARGIAW